MGAFPRHIASPVLVSSLEGSVGGSAALALIGRFAPSYQKTWLPEHTAALFQSKAGCTTSSRWRCGRMTPCFAASSPNPRCSFPRIRVWRTAALGSHCFLGLRCCASRKPAPSPRLSSSESGRGNGPYPENGNADAALLKGLGEAGLRVKGAQKVTWAEVRRRGTKAEVRGRGTKAEDGRQRVTRR